MRPITLMSLTLTVLCVSVVVLVSPAYLVKLLNFPGLLIVFGGTLLAVMLSKPQHEVVKLLRDLPAIYKNLNQLSIGSVDVKYLMKLAHLHRSNQLRLLEKELAELNQPLLKKGVQLILDRCTGDELKQLLNREKAKLLHGSREQARILRLMSTYAPAFGMLGTLLGLIHMLYGLEGVGLGAVGSTMGFALLTTLYGLLAANLVFKPLAIKRELSSAQAEAKLDMFIEGLLMVLEKKHPLIVNDMLESYCLPAEVNVATRPKRFFTKMLPMVTTHVD